VTRGIGDEAAEEARQPGLIGRLRELAPRRKSLRADLVAGVPGAIGSVPDGMAAAVLAGVNPVHGLYASFAGPIGGGFFSSTRLMVITTTSAAALAAGSTAAALPSEERGDAVVLIALLAGLAIVAAGLLRLGRYTRFVSHSVMMGFLTGVALNIVFGQLPDVTGSPAVGSTATAKAVHVLTHPSQIALGSTAVGVGAIAILIVSQRTRLASFGAVLALVIPTLVALLFAADVITVNDTGTIPKGVPLPDVPSFHLLSASLVGGALAVAAIVLVQGAGVAESAPNPDGRRSNMNRDFVGQGVGNLASAAFRGMPVGGSVGQTALNRAAGARTRWAGIFSGLWMLLILVLFAGVVGRVMMPTLAGVLIVAAIGSLRPRELTSIVRSSKASAVAAVTTLVATLVLPVTAAVGIGVALSLLLQLNQEALDLRVVQLEPDGDGLIERPGPIALASESVTILDVYGSVLYAGARTLQARLPDPAGHRRTVVVLRMRGRTAVGVTFLVVIEDYVRRLEAVGGRLYLTGLAPSVAQSMREDARFDGRAIELATAEARVGASSLAAASAAAAWLTEQTEEST
jgi:SulP family sulfate permease